MTKPKIPTSEQNQSRIPRQISLIDDVPVSVSVPVRQSPRRSPTTQQKADLSSEYTPRATDLFSDDFNDNFIDNNDLQVSGNVIPNANIGASCSLNSTAEILQDLEKELNSILQVLATTTNTQDRH